MRTLLSVNSPLLPVKIPLLSESTRRSHSFRWVPVRSTFPPPPLWDPWGRSGYAVCKRNVTARRQLEVEAVEAVEEVVEEVAAMVEAEETA